MRRCPRQPIRLRYSTDSTAFDSVGSALYLRLREPDDTIGYSILIYEVNADDLDAAFNQPLSQWSERANRSN